MKNIVYIIFSLMVTELYSNSCIVDIANRDIVRSEFTFHETIQSEHFVIHFTTADVDSQLVSGAWYNLQSNFGYAQSIIDQLEAAYSIYISSGWESPPPDCDETITNPELPQHCNNFGGNALYDIYISNEAVGMVVPETLYPVAPYTRGYSSYMKIHSLLNEYNSLPSWGYYVIAHELHHSIQMRYGTSVSGEPGNYMFNGWLFEQTASYMENVIYPNNIHLSTMLSNCDASTPLTYPEYNIDYPSDIYPYRSALWQKYMVESYGDSSIIRLIWEDYGIQYSSGDPVSLFPIYDDAIQLVTNNEIELSDAYQGYAVWRYFTGSRALPGEHFLSGQIYCDASVVNISDDAIILSSEKGAARLIQLASETINLQLSSSLASFITLQHVRESGIIDNIELTGINSYLNLNNPNNESHALILTSKYTGDANQEIAVYISLNNLQEDLNGDGTIDILDVIIFINMILDEEYDSNADLNEDGSINVIDIVILVNTILNGI